MVMVPFVVEVNYYYYYFCCVSCCVGPQGSGEEEGAGQGQREAAGRTQQTETDREGDL